MEQLSEAKSARLLAMYSGLIGGETLNKSILARKYGISERSVQRDIASLRCFLSEQVLPQEIIYDRKDDGFKLIFCSLGG